MLKRYPGLERFRRWNGDYLAQAVIGENGGNDEWLVNLKIWKKPHEKTWRYQYKSKGQMCTATGVAYEAKEGNAEGIASVAEAHKLMRSELEKEYA